MGKRMYPGDERELPVRRDGGLQRPRRTWGLVPCEYLEANQLKGYGTTLLCSWMAVLVEGLVIWPREGPRADSIRVR